MASNSFDMTRLNNFELSDHWGDDSSSKVTKRSRSHRPSSHKPSPPPAAPVKKDSSMKQSPVQEDPSNEKLCLHPGEVLSAFRRRVRESHSKSGASKNSKEGEPGSRVVKLSNRKKLKIGAVKEKGTEGGEKENDKIEEENEMEVEKVEGGEEKEKKFSITIPLSKWEIEEDIFTLTGVMPNIHPKKQPNNLQRVLNVIFPGLYLTSITPDSYKVTGPSKKRKRRS